jgi:hypothetical protein
MNKRYSHYFKLGYKNGKYTISFNMGYRHNEYVAVKRNKPHIFVLKSSLFLIINKMILNTSCNANYIKLKCRRTNGKEFIASVNHKFIKKIKQLNKEIEE